MTYKKPAGGLKDLIEHIADAVVEVDRSGKPFKSFSPGAGPYGEPQLTKCIASYLNTLPTYGAAVQVKRSPDLYIPDSWAIEIKLIRPFGDNGRVAENWSVNLLHPYVGNVSAIGDCLKLIARGGLERRACIAIGYEHTPPLIPLKPLFESFEVIAAHVMRIGLGPRQEACRTGLVHPVHQQLHVVGWEVLH